MATSFVNRSWQADGSGKAGAGAGRGLGKGTSCAAAPPAAARTRISGKRTFTPAFLIEVGYRQLVDCAARKGRTQVTITLDMHRFLHLTRAQIGRIAHLARKRYGSGTLTRSADSTPTTYGQQLSSGRA